MVETPDSRYVLALMRDTSKLIALGRSAPVVKNEIKVYSPGGEGLIWFAVGAFPLLFCLTG
jgi:hypothetical protein